MGLLLRTFNRPTSPPPTSDSAALNQSFTASRPADPSFALGESLDESDDDHLVIVPETPILIDHGKAPTDPAYAILEFERLSLAHESYSRKTELRRAAKAEIRDEAFNDSDFNREKAARLKAHEESLNQIRENMAALKASKLAAQAADNQRVLDRLRGQIAAAREFVRPILNKEERRELGELTTQIRKVRHQRHELEREIATVREAFPARKARWEGAVAELEKEVRYLIRHVGREQELLCTALGEEPAGDPATFMKQAGGSTTQTRRWIAQIEEMHARIVQCKL
jgi:hypothetical protein